MANSFSNIIPVMFASGFDIIDYGKYSLPSDVSRDVEDKIKSMGDTVTVPLIPAFTAADYTPGSAAAATDITQTSVSLVLNKSKRVTFQLSEKELSLSPYSLKETFAVPAMEELLRQINADIITEGLTTTNSVELTGTTPNGVIAAADVRTAKKTLDTGKAGLLRFMHLSIDQENNLLADSEFKSLTGLATPEQMATGIIADKYGFKIKGNHAFTSTNHGLAFHPSGIAFAARTYSEPEAGVGVNSLIALYQGIPFRVLAKYTDDWNLKIQIDVLYGVKLVKASRVVKLIDAA